MAGRPGVSIQDAIARAKEIAARITSGKAATAPSTGSVGDGLSPSGSSSSLANAPWNKRPLSDDGSDTPPAKFSRPGVDTSDKVALAASIAAKLASKLGGSSAGSSTGGPAPTPFPSGGQFSSSAVRNDSVAIPDRHVGYLIGRGGETIQRIVRESGCKVQIAQEQTGPERTATLNGTDQQIDHAKSMIRDVLEKASETEQSKALAAELSQHGGRGHPNQFSESGPPRGGGGGGGGGGGSGPRDRDRPYGTSLDSCDDDPPDYITEQQLVPTTRVALIIGRGGDTIRRLQEMHRVKMELAHKPTETDEKGVASHVLKVRGLPPDVRACSKIVLGVVEGSLHTNQIFRMPTGSDSGSYYPESHPEMGGGKPNDVQTRQFPVPVDKAGIVIGRGGESIKEICRISGAHCEISKERDPNARTKPFSITGTTQQIDAAIRLISQKAGLGSSPSENDYPPYPPSGGYPGYPPSSGPGYPPQGAWGGGGGGGGGGYHPGSHWPPQPGHGAGGDPSAYGNYYSNWYGQQWHGNQNQPGMPPPPPSNGSQDQPPGTVSSHSDSLPDKPPGAPDASAPNGAAPTPSVNPSTGQADYTDAWIEYYRRSGMHDYANWIAQCAKQQGSGAPSDKPNDAPAPPPSEPQPPAPAPAQPAGAAPPSSSSAADYAAYYAQYYAQYGYYGYPGAQPQPPSADKN